MFPPPPPSVVSLTAATPFSLSLSRLLSLSLCRPPLWSSGQNSWLHIQRSGFHSRCREYGSVTLTTWRPLSTKFGTNFAEKLRSLGWFCSLADSGHWVFFLRADINGRLLWMRRSEFAFYKTLCFMSSLAIISFYRILLRSQIAEMTFRLIQFTLWQIGHNAFIVLLHSRLSAPIISKSAGSSSVWICLQCFDKAAFINCTLW
jgi:hypothetical protein